MLFNNILLTATVVYLLYFIILQIFPNLLQININFVMHEYKVGIFYFMHLKTKFKE